MSAALVGVACVVTITTTPGALDGTIQPIEKRFKRWDARCDNDNVGFNTVRLLAENVDKSR